MDATQTIEVVKKFSKRYKFHPSHTRQLLDEDVINRVQQGQHDQQYQQSGWSSQAALIDNVKNMTPNERMAFLCDKFGEREMLIKIADCKSRNDIGKLLAIFYPQENMDPLYRYIRLAFAIFDNAFIYDDKFTSKRADCYSNITKKFEDINNQHVDFILRSINDNSDYLSAEEKPGFKGVKNYIRKGKALQKAMLRRWTDRLGSVEIMKKLEAITCQWQRLKLTLYRTRSISEDKLVAYKKGSFSLNIILEAKYAHELETMHFSSDDETFFRSDSTADLEHQDKLQDIDAQISGSENIDPELETHILEALDNIEPEADVVTCKDLEDLILERISRKRKAGSINRTKS
ncbi:hypothetical protein INT45_012961 [Circinella minor]|uniref:Uncharacterized protein n=1 Tax=Circinella minor TaxID=1195481 RepID=A0A8H7RSU6_9FUNG|nr:hypothetical protein INT45_012961 [Circinella minor]